MKVVNGVVFLIFVYTVLGHPTASKIQEEDSDYDASIANKDPDIQNDEYEYGTDDENTEDAPEPVLTTTSQVFIAKENQTVRLPCQLENGDNLVVHWKKNSDIIFQDNIKFDTFGNNFHIENRTLVISNVGANETANYTCSVPLTQKDYLSVTHQLFVETAPQIVSISALHDVVQLDAGNKLVLTCKAIGYPSPSITWARGGFTLGKSETIVIEKVSHEDVGDYQCLADNKINPPAHKHIHIDVAHKPIVKIEKLTVNSDKNLNTKLICYVHGVPDPVVSWKKDGTNIISSKRKHIQHYNHTHVLEINQVQKEDFGVYTCLGTNRIGKSEKQVTLTGLPGPAKHVSTKIDGNGNIELIWNVESNSPIAEYLVEYRLNGDPQWSTQKPEVTNPEGNFYTVNHTLPNLADGHYEVKLKSMNTYGWSDYSDVIQVRNGEYHHSAHTPHHHHHHTSEPHMDQPDKAEQVKQVEEQKERSVQLKTQVSESQQANGKGKSGSSTRILPSLAALLLTLLAIYTP